MEVEAGRHRSHAVSDRPLTDTQERVLIHLADRGPAWVIRAGRITTLQVLEKLGLAQVTLGSYGWEARITQKGLDLIGTMGD